VKIYLNRSLLTDLPWEVPGCQPATMTGHRLRVRIHMETESLYKVNKQNDVKSFDS